MSLVSQIKKSKKFIGILIMRTVRGMSVGSILEKIIAGLIVASLSFFIAEKLNIIQSADLELYIEAGTAEGIAEDEMILRLFVKNKGSIAAKNIRLTIELKDTEIINNEGFTRVDDLYGGIPTIQYDTDKLVYPGGGNSCIGEIIIRKKDLKGVSLPFHAFAENAAAKDGYVIFSQD